MTDKLKNNEINIIKDYNSGLSLKKIKKKYGHSHWILVDLLKNNGCVIRDRVTSHKIFNFNESYFERIDSHEKAYWLGFIYADGNIHENKLQIGLNNKDIEILNNFKKTIQSEHKLYKDGHNETKFIVRSKRMCDDLNRLGVSPRKSLTLLPPTEDVVNKEFINSFLLGYFDGDGHIGITYTNDKYRYKKWRFELISTKEFVEFCKNILDKITERNGCLHKEKRTKKNVWYLTYGGACVSKETASTPNKLRKYLYKNFGHPLIRKKKVFENICLGQIY